MAIIAINLACAAAACRGQVCAPVGECVRLHTSTTLTGSANNLFCSEYIRLYMYVNMYVCMCIYGHVCIYIYLDEYRCMHVHMCGSCVYLFTHEFVFVSIIPICVQVCMCVSFRACVCVRALVYIEWADDPIICHKRGIITERREKDRGRNVSRFSWAVMV